MHSIRHHLNCDYFGPGGGFRNRSHSTTRDCIEALELAFQSQPVCSALDLGTGTGILASQRHGWSLRSPWRRYEPLAAKTAQRNIRLNQLQQAILAVQGSADDFIHIQAICDRQTSIMM